MAKKNETLTLKLQTIGELKVSSVKTGETVWEKKGMSRTWHYTYRITLQTEYGKTSFAFQDSYKNYIDRHDKLNRQDLISALECFISDVDLFLNDEIDGCYDEPKEAARVKRGCEREYDKLVELIGGADVWDVIQEIDSFIRDNS